MQKIIAITGAMGTGKTTLGRELAFRAGYMFIEERFMENPYLEDATQRQKYLYENIHWFINSDYQRYKQGIEIANDGIGVIIDKPFYEEYTYAALAGLTSVELGNIHDLLDELTRNVIKPDIIIDLTLRSSELSRRISTRGREFEGSITSSWLEAFNKAHETELYRWPKVKRLVIDVESYDFRKTDDIELIYQLIMSNI